MAKKQGDGDDQPHFRGEQGFGNAGRKEGRISVSVFRDDAEGADDPRYRSQKPEKGRDGSKDLEGLEEALEGRELIQDGFLEKTIGGFRIPFPCFLHASELPARLGSGHRARVPCPFPKDGSGRAQGRVPR